jgi:enoyl-CoA hydratase/carnithine racemase
MATPPPTGSTEVPGLELRPEGAALVVTIDRGERNSFSGEMMRTLADAVHRAGQDPELRLMRIRALGDAFCLGRDQEGETADELRRIASSIVTVNEAIRTSPLVSVCEVTGDAAGFGVGLTASCDVAVAADSAEFWFPELEAGLAPTVVLSWLTRLLPPKRAFELVATGRRVGAAEAVSLGLVTEAVPAGDVARLGDEWAALLCERDGAALRDLKRFLSLTRAMDDASAAQAAVDALALGAARRKGR